MYNTDIPTRAELPTTQQLVRSTLIAIGAAAAILVAVVLPAEYSVDPTGIGRALGLAQMGQIKTQLAEEAERDRLKDAPQTAPAAPPGQSSGLLGRVVAGLFVAPAAAQAAPAERSDVITISLKPGEGAEIKLVMTKGAKVAYSWSASEGAVNFDLHGDGPGQATSYEKGRGVPAAEGTLVAEFTGNHGWFFRNRERKDLTVTLRVKGAYADVKQMR